MTQTKPTISNFSKYALLFLSAFIIRSSVFYFYVQHNERYWQSDSQDYHVGALGIALGIGMHRVDNLEPIFWRTPGYPAYLAAFYSYFGLTSARFEDNAHAQKTSIWLQIFLCSFLPLLIFALSLLLTQSAPVAWLAAWVSVFHLGFVLSSCYILTDALALLVFMLFLIYFFKSFNNLSTRIPDSLARLTLRQASRSARWATQDLGLRPYEASGVVGQGERMGRTFTGTRKKNNYSKSIFYLLCAALALAIFTWIRPMGQFIAILSALCLLFLRLKFAQKLTAILLFLTCFFGLISPWYMRNYNLTGSIFFCPLFGPYLTVFSAPKIKARVDNITLEQSHKILSHEGGKAAQEDKLKAIARGLQTRPSKELSALRAALPWILNYPHYFLLDWTTEVVKTTFDLYSSQLVNFAANTFKWDPLTEYLPQKLAACLYKQPMPLAMRLICWLEFFCTILLWIGLLFGIYNFIIKPITHKQLHDKSHVTNFNIWLIAALLSITTVGMTGGFGYGRLRLPIEPLLLILTLQAWVYIAETYKFRNLLKQNLLRVKGSLTPLTPKQY